jgi:hypothetical protein
MPYLTVSAIEQKVKDLAAAHPQHCAQVEFVNHTFGGKAYSYLRITKDLAAGRPAALIIGGIHAREWVPPDSILSLAERLLTAYATSTAISYSVFSDLTDPLNPVPYGPYTIPFDQVKAIVERLDLYLVPLSNPDGREYSQLVDPGWRKNRRDAPPGKTEKGVDINRNFPIAWDHKLFYTAAAASTARVTDDPDDPLLGDTYRGRPSSADPHLPELEAETKNLVSLFTDKKIQFFLDIHSASRFIMYPWGMETDQSADTSQNFKNHDWDLSGVHGGRDGTLGVAYQEYFPNDPPRRLLNQHIDLGNRMRDAIVASAGANATAKDRSTYAVKASIGLYPTTGASDDFAFSQQFNPGSPQVFSFTMECGSQATHPVTGVPIVPDDYEGFQPDYHNKFAKINREVHAAIFAYLSSVAGWSSSSRCLFNCFIATSVFESPWHRKVRFLRELRDLEFKSTESGRRFMAWAEPIYYKYSPYVAYYLDHHAFIRRLAGSVVVSPFIRALHAGFRLVKPIRNRERRIRWLSFYVMLLLIGGGVLTLGLLFILLWVLGRSLV